MAKHYCYSLNGQDYDGYFDTKEEAIKEGTEYAVDAEKTIFFIGLAEKTFSPHIDVDWLIESIQEDAYDHGGEYAEDYLEGVTKEQKQELEEKLNDVFGAWTEKHKHEVNFYEVVDSEEITIQTK